MTIRPRGNAFQIDVKVAARDNPTKQPVRIRAMAKDENAARRLEAEVRASIMQSGTWLPPKSGSPDRANGTLAAALEEAWNCPTGRRRGWKYQRTGREQYVKAKACIDHLGPARHCATVTTADFDALALHFEGLGNGSDTIAYKLQAFSRVLFYAQRLGWITHRPLWERPAPGQPREFIFTPELEAKLVEYFRDLDNDPLMADLLVLGIETGLRLGELLFSERRDWDTAHGVVMVRSELAKSGHSRTVTLTKRAAEAIAPYLVGLEANQRPLRIAKQAVASRMRKARAYFQQPGNEEFCFHATRHTRATRLARQTRDPFMVMMQLGHADVKTSMRYIKLAAVDPLRVTPGASDLVPLT